jgi:DNA invertase Pin-like site-specific DNA recombinase
MRAIAYVRVSTALQAADGVSLDAQEARIRAYCDFSGLDLVAVYADAGVSGKRACNREELQKALAAICTGKAKALVVYKLDRLARCTIDALEITQTIEKCGGSLHSLSEKLDTSSATGRFFFTLLASLAEMERGIIAERTRSALAFKRERGEATGPAPFGHDIGPDGKTLVANAQEQVVLRVISYLDRKGMSQRGIVAGLNSRGLKTKSGGQWTRSSLRSVVQTAERRKLTA